MSDIFREVEEDVRKERLEKLWKQYGDYVIAGVAALVIGVGGYKLWQQYEEQQRAKASAAFSVAVQMSDSGKNDLAAQAFAKIAKEAPSGYAGVARLSEADALLSAGKADEAIALYKAIAAKDSSELGQVARIRAAWAEADTASKSDLQAWLAPLNDAKSPWRFMAREILAYSDFRDGRLQQAQREFDGLQAEAEAPVGLRQRAGAMATLIRTSGAANYGTVPLPAPPGGAPAQKGTAKP